MGYFFCITKQKTVNFNHTKQKWQKLNITQFQIIKIIHVIFQPRRLFKDQNYLRALHNLQTRYIVPFLKHVASFLGI